MPEPVRLRAAARRDVEIAVLHYTDQGGVELADRFIAAVEAAREHLAALPSSGSPRLALETGIEHLRSWSLRGFPYLVVYLDRVAYVDVLRLLHQRRDISRALTNP